MFSRVLAVIPALLVTIPLPECGAAIDHNTSTTAFIATSTEDSSPSTSIITAHTQSSSTSATLESETAPNSSSTLTSTFDSNDTNKAIQSTTEGHPTTSSSSWCDGKRNWSIPVVQTCPCLNDGTCVYLDSGTPIARKICHCPYGYGGHRCDKERPTKAALMYSLWWIVLISLGSLAFAAIRHHRQTKFRPLNPHERFVDVLNRAPQPSNNA